MNEWASIVAGSSQDDDFNKTPSCIGVVDEKILPFTQSTPRASFGQKLLSCDVLLNVSNVSADGSYNFSGTQVNTNSNSIILKEKTDLEEEIKRLEHQMHKLVSENEMVKSQLALSEEQNENLQADLGRCRTRLISEQQMIEHLQKNQLNSDEFKEEMMATSKDVVLIKKKLLQCEEEKSNLDKNYQKLEEDYLILQDNIQQLNKREVELKKEMVELKAEVEIREHKILELTGIIERLKEQVEEKMDVIKELNIGHELLEQKKNKLEKMMSRFSSSLYNTCISDSMAISYKDISSEDEFFLESQLSELRNTSHESLQHELLKAGDYETLLSRYHTEVAKNSELHEQMTSLKTEIGSIKSKQNAYEENLDKKLNEYKNIVENLERQEKELNSENELLKQQLEIQKKDVELCSENSCSSSEKSSSEPKNLSFEKQKITINRLKEKIEYLETQTSIGHCTIDDLRHRLDKKDIMEIEWLKLKRQYDEDKNTSARELEELQKLNNKLLNDIKFQAENHTQEKSTWKLRMEELRRQISEFQESFKSRFQKDDRIRENTEALEELRMKLQDSESRCKYILDERANFNLEKQHLEQLVKEWVQKYQDLASQLSQTEESLQITYIELHEKKDQYNKLQKKFEDRLELVSELETELAKVSDELNDKNNAYSSLFKQNKMLQGVFSKSDDYKEKELMDIDEKIRNGHVMLQDMDRECDFLRQKIKNSKDELVRVKSILEEHTAVIYRCSRELNRAFTLITERWHYLLEDDVEFNMLPQVRACESPYILEALFGLGDNVRIVVSLLEILANKASFEMEEAESNLTLVRQLTSSYETKNIQKFTLRPAKLILHRPVSPDSPSLEIDNSCDNSDQELIKQGSQPISSNNEFSGEDVDKDKRVFEEYCVTQIPMTPIEMRFQDSLPQITDVFLQNLGWNEGSPKRNLSQDESETLLNAVTAQITMDSKDLEDRLLKQHEYCQKQHKKCFYLIKDISLRLRDHKCIGATDSIYPVFVLLEDIRFLLHEIVQSAGQLGILTCENRMMKCWNLVTDHMSLIKQTSASVELELNERTQTQVVDSESLVNNNRDEPIEDNEPTAIERLVVIEKENRFSAKCHRWCKLTLAWMIFACTVSFSALIFLHFWCQVTTEHQVCPLDDFIKKIQIGNPPY